MADWVKDKVSDSKAARRKFVNSVIEKNRGKSFIERIVNPTSYDPVKNEDGSVSTHGMAVGENNGKFLVYPTVQRYGAGLRRFDGDAAWKLAIELGKTVEFDNSEDANRFARDYKSGWEE